MADVASVKIKIDKNKFKAIEKLFKQDTVMMAADIAKKARSNAPVLTGNLQSSIRIEEREGAIVIVAGGSWNWNVPYALRQEYEHKTKKHYMLNAKNSVMSGNWLQKYYGGVA